IGLRIRPQLAAEPSGDAAPHTTEELNQLGTEVQLAIDELRALAAGVFPAVLGDFGPAAAHVRIAAHGRELTFEVTDNGLGFDAGTVALGAGLHNMHDRVASLGGSLTIDAARGHGTRIAGLIPGAA